MLFYYILIRRNFLSDGHDSNILEVNENDCLNIPATIMSLDKSILQLSANNIIYEEEIEPSLTIEPVSKENTVEYEIPSVDTSFKTYTDYRCITDKTSKQYEIRKQCYTDENGMRRLVANNDYIIALGTYYTNEVGVRFRITLDTGIKFYATVGDIKDDADTDNSNRYIPQNGNLVEFHIDANMVPEMVAILGNISYFEQFKGQVIKIEKIIEE